MSACFGKIGVSTLGSLEHRYDFDPFLNTIVAGIANVDVAVRIPWSVEVSVAIREVQGACKGGHSAGRG